MEMGMYFFFMLKLAWLGSRGRLSLRSILVRRPDDYANQEELTAWGSFRQILRGGLPHKVFTL